MKIKFVLLIIGLSLSGMAFASTTPNYSLVHIYNNTNAVVSTSYGVAGEDLLNLDHKSDCTAQYSNWCVSVDGLGKILPHMSITAKVVSNVHSIVSHAFLNGAVQISIETPEGNSTNSVMLPVEVNPYVALILQDSYDLEKNSYEMGASTVSNYWVYPKYIVSVVAYLQGSDNAPVQNNIAIIINNNPLAQAH